MTPKEILIGARALLVDPTKWLKGISATNSDGQEVDPRGSTAQCFCTLGALQHAGPKDKEDDTTEHHAARSLLRQTIGRLNVEDPDWVGPVAAYNDHPDTKHADVLAWFDRAIAA